MDRLWVRLSLMLSGVLIFVFFMQFLSIVLTPDPPSDCDNDLHHQAEEVEIMQILVEFMLFSTLVGFVGGGIIGRVVSAPMDELAQAARKISEGDLSARVTVRGSREMVLLGELFNKMVVELEQAEQVRHKLMADVSHELRTPLTVLAGNLRASLDHIYALDEAEIANLYRQTHHLIRLVNDLRELSLAETQQLPLYKQTVELNALLDDTIQALEPLAAEVGVQLLNQTPPLPRLTADPARMRQVLFNLLTNALRHTPSGGQIIISGSHDSSHLHLQIQDNGEGLEAEQLRAIFDRFYRVDKSRSRETGGTGLGLAIVRAMIEAHGGNIHAWSAGKGQGTTFVLTLRR